MEAPGCAYIGPFSEKLSVSIENLNPFIRAVSDIDATLRVESHVVHQVEFAVACPLLPPMKKVVAILVELDHAGVNVTVGNIHVSIRREGDRGRLVESVLAVVSPRKPDAADGH